jgi:hypothetical protein
MSAIVAMLQLGVSGEVMAHLQALAGTGLFGHSPSAAAERLLCEKLRTLSDTGGLLDPNDPPEPLRTVSQVRELFALPSSTLSKRLNHCDCPPFEAVRGPSLRILRLRLNPRLRAYLERAKR